MLWQRLWRIFMNFWTRFFLKYKSKQTNLSYSHHIVVQNLTMCEFVRLQSIVNRWFIGVLDQWPAEMSRKSYEVFKMDLSVHFTIRLVKPTAAISLSRAHDFFLQSVSDHKAA